MAEKIGILTGSGIDEKKIVQSIKNKKIITEFGKVDAYETEKFLIIQRHGNNKTVLPHLINNKANIMAFKESKIDKIIGIGSTGSMKEKIEPGNILVPDDFIDLFHHQTFFNKDTNSIFNAFKAHKFDESMRKKIIDSAQELDIKIINKGVYFCTKGPRYETKAEIRIFAGFGDIVGMTLASEVILSGEAGISYAAICTIDNFANGIKGIEINSEDIKNNSKMNQDKIMSIINRIRW